MVDPLRHPDPRPDTRRRWLKVLAVIALVVILLVVVVMLAGGGLGGHGPGRHTGGSGGDTVHIEARL
jgi:ferric-dicitrate binding protein FerR (iron transport regulator)